MTKFLLAILLIITGFKLIGESSAYVIKHGIIKLWLHDEEGKNQKEEHKKCKHDNEDTFYPNQSLQYGWERSVAVLPHLPNHQQYSRLAKEPNTPPPDVG